MITRRTFARRLAWAACVATLALGLAGVDHARAQSPCTPRKGPTKGVWELPDYINPTGYAKGLLYDGISGHAVYVFKATIDEVPGPCLACRQGNVIGELDDGVGPGPDYYVTGTWNGHQFSGQGSWTATIYKPIGPAIIAVGALKGTFNDPLGSTTPGRYDGSWEI
jgi:hypothetical protein